VNSDFNISYVDESTASGEYVKDVLGFGGIKLEGLQFAVGLKSTSQQGVMGIGYVRNEVQVVRYGRDPYPNIPALMKEQGFIKANAYSLWLNDLDADTGSILFGGVDTEKFVGSLQTLPVKPTNGTYSDFLVELNSVRFGGDTLPGVAESFAVPTVLDSGATLTYLPATLTRAVYNRLDAQYIDESAFVDCDLVRSSDTLDFSFGSITISVPMNEMLLAAIYPSNSDPLCQFGKFF
jgi:hypothetical protein